MLLNAISLTDAICRLLLFSVPCTPSCHSPPLLHNRNRFLVDIITTMPFDAIVLAALQAPSSHQINPEGTTSRYVALLGLLKLGRMYRVGVMFRNMSYNLNLGLLALTLLRNFTVRLAIVLTATSRRSSAAVCISVHGRMMHDEAGISW
jgi:hypothetical protein